MTTKRKTRAELETEIAVLKGQVAVLSATNEKLIAAGKGTVTFIAPPAAAGCGNPFYVGPVLPGPFVVPPFDPLNPYRPTIICSDIPRVTS